MIGYEIFLDDTRDETNEKIEIDRK